MLVTAGVASVLVIVFPSDPENTLPSCVDQSAGTVQRGQLARSHYGQDQVLDRAVLGSSGRSFEQGHYAAFTGAES